METRSPFLAPHSLRAILLVCLLLPLLAACGGSAGAPTSSGARQGAAPLPTAGPADSSMGGTTGGAGDTSGKVAPAATAATAAEPPMDAAAPGADLGRSSSGMAPAPTAAMAPQEGGGIALAPTPPLPERNPNQQQGISPLKAGEVDDNRDFAAYREYLRSFYSPPGRAVDVSERYILTVVNDKQQPVLDAHVQVFDGERPLFEGRTYAGGKTILLPRALGASQNPTLRVVIDKGNSRAEGTLTRGQEERPTFVLPGAEPVAGQVRLDVLFLLDATGSMGDEIGRIQETIVSIADRIDGFSPRPELRFGLVAYRDRGEEYVTRASDFTPDVQAFRAKLLEVQASGGGDEPEALNEGLHAAVEQVGWRDNAVRLVFLVADAPPHLDYPGDIDYVQGSRAAVAKGIKIYTIAASNTNDDAEYIFRQLAQQTLAHFIFLTYQSGQNAGAPGETTQRHVDPQAFTVDRLDDLVVQMIQRELASAAGAS